MHFFPLPPGSNIGTVISLPISGWLCTLHYGGGWPLCFYLFGGLGVVWFVLWMFLVYDTPQKHPRICPKEVEYINWSIGPQVRALFRLFWFSEICLFTVLLKKLFLFAQINDKYLKQRTSATKIEQTWGLNFLLQNYISPYATYPNLEF